MLLCVARRKSPVTALIDVIAESPHVTMPDFVLFMLTVFFGVAIIFADARLGGTTAIDVNGDGNADVRFTDAEVGSLAIQYVLCFCLEYLTLQTYKARALTLSSKFLVLALLTQGAFAVVGWFTLQLLPGGGFVLPALLVLFPLLSEVLIITYWHYLVIDWRIVLPSEQRNPPHRSWCSAFWGLGLPWWDYKTMALSAMSVAMILATGLIASFGIEPNHMGSVVSLGLFCAVFTFIPASKFSWTLDFDSVDRLFCLLNILCASAGYAITCIEFELDLKDILLGACALLGFFTANLLGYGLFELTKYRKGNKKLYAGLGLFLVTFLCAITWVCVYVDVRAGVGALCALALLMVAMLHLHRWHLADLTFSPRMLLASVLLVAVLAAAAVAMTMWDGSPWWVSLAALSAVAFLYAMGYLERARMGKKPLCFGDTLFPVYYLNKRTQNLESAHAPLAYMAKSLTVYVLWVLFLIEFGAPEAIIKTDTGASPSTLVADLGLLSLAFVMICLFTTIRTQALSTDAIFTKLEPFMSTALVLQAIREARAKQQKGMPAEIVLLAKKESSDDAAAAALIGILTSHNVFMHIKSKRPSGAQVAEFEADEKDLEAAREVEVADGEEGQDGRKAPRITSTVDIATAERLEELVSNLAAVSELKSRETANFFFVITSLAKSQLDREEVLFKEFIAWCAQDDKGDLLPPLRADISDEEIFDGAHQWTPADIDAYRRRKARFLMAKASKQADNDRRRREEGEAMQRTRDIEAKRSQELEAKHAVQQRPVAKDPAVAGRAEEGAIDDSDSELQPSDDELEGGEMTEAVLRTPYTGDSIAMYKEILAQHSADNPYTDEDFSPNDASIYYDGYRNIMANQGSALLKTRIVDWKRPGAMVASGAKVHLDACAPLGLHIFVSVAGSAGCWLLAAGC
jgi:hypothetical protein